MGVFYLDTSALVKFVVAEPESAALSAWVDPANIYVTSDLARTELLRAVRRTAPERTVLAREVLALTNVLDLTPQLMDRAGLLDPVVLRSLDAIHLAAALTVGEELSAIVTYDARMAAAAVAHGIRVVAPS